MPVDFESCLFFSRVNNSTRTLLFYLREEDSDRQETNTHCVVGLRAKAFRTVEKHTKTQNLFWNLSRKHPESHSMDQIRPGCHQSTL